MWALKSWWCSWFILPAGGRKGRPYGTLDTTRAREAGGRVPSVVHRDSGGGARHAAGSPAAKGRPYGTLGTTRAWYGDFRRAVGAGWGGRAPARLPFDSHELLGFLFRNCPVPALPVNLPFSMITLPRERTVSTAPVISRPS